MVKIKIKELSSNPFKKNINGGKLNTETVKKIKSNIKELGLMGSLPVFKKDNKYYLIAGHHRLQALKEVYGNNFEIECTLHNYSEENILRGMIVENLTQRGNELMEVTENLNAIRKFLRGDSVQQPNTLGKGGRGVEEQGSVRDIHKWLNKAGDVMSIGKISEYLKVYDNLDRSLLKQAVKVEGARQDGHKLSIEEAKTLSKLDKGIQKPMKEILDETGLNYKEESKLVTEFVNSSEEMQKKVLDKEIDIKDIKIERLKEDIKQKIENDKGKIIVTHYKKYQRDAGNKVGDTNDKILQTCLFLNGLDKSGVLYELDWKTMLKIIESGNKYGRDYTKFMDKILEKVG